MINPIIKPSPELVAKLENMGPRIRYHPIAEYKIYDNLLLTPQQYYESFATGENEFIHKANIFTFDDYLITDLNEKIAKEWKPQLPVRVRGTVLNIGEEGITLEDGAYIKTLNEVLQSGTERDGDVDQTLFENANEGIPHRSRQWVLQSTDDLRARATPKQQQFLFPAITVYNHQLFSPNNNKLPESPTDRANAILCIYILDYVRPIKEL